MQTIVNALFVREGKSCWRVEALNAPRIPVGGAFRVVMWSMSETMTEALVREVKEEIGVTPTTFSSIGTIADPNTAKTDPATYHMYHVSEWIGGEPAVLGKEHTELCWFKPSVALALSDLALEEYRPLLRGMISGISKG